MEAVSLQGTHWLIKQQLAQVVAAIEADDYREAANQAELASALCGSVIADNHTRATVDLVWGIALLRWGKWLRSDWAQNLGRRKLEAAYHTLITINHPAAWKNAAVAALVLQRIGDALDLLARAMRRYAENGDRERYAQVSSYRKRVGDSLVNAAPIVYVEGQMLT